MTVQLSMAREWSIEGCGLGSQPRSGISSPHRNFLDRSLEQSREVRINLILRFLVAPGEGLAHRRPYPAAMLARSNPNMRI